MINDNDTIAAIATPFGNSGIGIIRISGSEAIKKADELIRSRSGKSLGLISMESHTVHYGFLSDEDRIIDEVLCTIYKAPRSFTAEDTAEISCHGGMYILNKALSVVLSHGIRLAEPGEFTKRAYLNGRIDLSQAESIMDIISSENEFSRSNSILQLNGSVKRKVNELRETIIHESAFIEAALDDPEHYEIEEDYRLRLKDIIIGLSEEIEKIIDNYDKVRYLKNGINTVIAGKPNVGKSSLLNLLSGYERAIVTSIPGTTRDIIKERISFDDLTLNITDTAGIRESADEVENIGISKAREEIEKADLVLFMIDSSEKIDDEDRKIFSMTKEKCCIVILNKTDKGSIISEEDIERMTDDPVVSISVREKTGLDTLKENIKNIFINESIRDNEIYITNKRQIELFRSAADSLRMVKESVVNGMSEDTFTVDFMDAYDHLGKVIGEDLSDDLTDRIFSEFCMGK